MPLPMQSPSGFEFLRRRPDALPDRSFVEKRRWASFLTWAFVLGEMAGRDGFLPTSAHAAEADATHDGHSGSGSTPIANALPNIDVTTQSESPEPITYQHAAPMPAYSADTTASALTDAKEIPTAELGAQLHLGAGGGGGGGSGGASSAEAGTSDAVGHDQVGLTLGDGMQSLDIGLHLNAGDALHDLLGLVPNTLGGLPIVGDTIEVIGGTLTSTVDGVLSTLQPLVSLVGVGDDNHGSFGHNLGLPGQLLFSTASDTSLPSEFVSPHGGYTTYGMSLSLGTDNSDASSADTSANPDAHGIMIDLQLSHAGDDAHSDALHLDQTVLKTAADILA